MHAVTFDGEENTFSLSGDSLRLQSAYDILKGTKCADCFDQSLLTLGIRLRLPSVASVVVYVHSSNTIRRQNWGSSMNVPTHINMHAAINPNERR